MAMILRGYIGVVCVMSLVSTTIFAHARAQEALAPRSPLIGNVTGNDTTRPASERLLLQYYVQIAPRLGPGNVKIFQTHRRKALAIWQSYLEALAKRYNRKNAETFADEILTNKETIPGIHEQLLKDAQNLFAQDLTLSETSSELELQNHYHGRFSGYETDLFRGHYRWTKSLNKCFLERIAERDQEGNRQLRFLSLAASTGAEAYSVAATIADALEEYATKTLELSAEEREKWMDGWDVQVIAADNALGPLFKAARGIYASKTPWGHTPLLRFFEEDGDYLRPNKRLRSWVKPVFSDAEVESDRNNLLEKPFDGIMMNNLLRHLMQEGSYPALLTALSDSMFSRDGTWFAHSFRGDMTVDIVASRGGMERPRMAEIAIQRSKWFAEAMLKSDHGERLRLYLEKLRAFPGRHERLSKIGIAWESPMPDLRLRSSREAMAKELVGTLMHEEIFQDLHALRLLLDLDRPKPPGSTKSGFVTEEEFTAFTDVFAEEVKRKLDAARSAFSDKLSEHDRSRFLADYVERSVFQEVFARLLPALLENRPLPTAQEFLALGHGLNYTMPKRIRQVLGRRYYYDPLGDYFAVLANQILTQTTPEELAQWDTERQYMANWIFIYNTSHIASHELIYEKNEYNPGTDMLLGPARDSFRNRDKNDLFLGFTVNLSLWQLMKEAYRNRPWAHRLFLVSFDHRVMPTPGDMAEHGFALLKDMRIFKDGIHHHGFGKPYSSLVGLGFADREDERLAWFQGMFNMHRLPLDQVLRQWNEVSNKPGPTRKSLSQIVQSFASLPQGSASAPVSSGPSHFKRIGTPSLLRDIVGPLPASWEDHLAPKHWRKLEMLLENAFENNTDSAKDWHHTTPVEWTQEDLSQLAVALPGTDSGAFKLAVLLYSLFSQMSDIHANIQPNGSISVVLDPMYEVFSGKNEEEGGEFNRAHYARLRAFREENPFPRQDAILSSL